MGWLVAHTVVIVVGLLVIVVVSSVVLAVGTAWSTGTAVDVGRILAAGAAYLPAELLVGGLALALFGLRPRALPVAYAAVAVVAFIAFLGPGLRLPTWVLDLSPTTHVGNPPLGAVEAPPLVVIGAIAAVLGGAAAMGFRRRGVPQP
jgi:ABC-2 type transport system permease protein